MFSHKIGEGESVVSEIVRASIQRGIFDREIYEKYGVLTSRGIQKRYFEIVKRRKNFEINGDILLVDAAIFSNDVRIKRKNVNISPENADISAQSKVKESKVLHTYAREDEDGGFSRFWDAYPKKSGDIRGACMEYLHALDSGATLADLLTALEWQRNQPRWLENQGQYIPSPEKWLRNRGWMQEKPKAPPPRKKNGMNPPGEPDPEAEHKKMEHMKRMYASMRREKKQ